MKLRLPSPAMVVAVIALVVALSGTAIAAVDFAQNAGAVDGKSAVGAKASLHSAAGKLVATSTGGNGKGQIPARFLEGVMRGGTRRCRSTCARSTTRPAAPRRCSSSPASGASTRSATTSTRRWARRRRARRSTSRPRSIRASTSRACSGATSAPASGPPSSARPRVSRCRSWPAPTGSSRSSWRPRAARCSSPAPRARTTAPGPNAACLIWGTAFRVG